MSKTKTIIVGDREANYSFNVTVTYPVNVGDTVTEVVADVCAQTLAEDVGSRVRSLYRTRSAKGETLTQEEVDTLCAEATLRVGGNRLDPVEAEMRKLAEGAAKNYLRQQGKKGDWKAIADNLMQTKTEALRKTAEANLRSYAKIDMTGVEG